jgi:predicted ATPase
MREGSSGKEFDLRGWVLSTGTLRVLALLACLRHPTKAPPVLFVEEIENGLDPRTVGLLVEEIRSAVESGSTQVIATTHSPYLLDKLSLSQLVLAERAADEPPRFTRPSDDKEVRAWSKEFAPGKLYSMGTLSKRAGSDDK